jgi:fatty acid desaturase
MDRRTLAELHRRSQWRPILHGTIIVSAYVTLAVAVNYTHILWLRFAISILLGALCVGWLSVIHECAHGLFVKNKRLNHLAAILWSCPTFLNFSLYRYFHLEHHRHTAVMGDTERGGTYKSIWTYIFGLLNIWWFPVRFMRLSILAACGRFPAYVRRK